MNADANPTSDTRLLPGNWLPLALVPLLCMAGAAVGYLIPDKIRGDLIAFAGFGICILLLAFIGLRIARIHGASLSIRGITGNLPLIGTCAVIVFIYSQIDHRANKVILDELILQSSAMQLLDNNEYRAPQFAENLSSEFSLHLGVPDKRPPMYPVVLSIVHRVLGYSQANGYILNGILGFLTLLLIGKAGEQIYPRWGGLLSILGMASIPLLSQNVTSQHLELLYLFLISFLFLTCLRITIRGNSGELSLAYLLAAAIALTRYEGLLFFMVPFAMHLFLAWKKQSVRELRAVYLICPLAIAYIFTLVGYIFTVPGFWQLDDLQNTSAFGIHYWQQNTGALLMFLFNTSRDLPGSLPLSMLCLASLPITILYISKSITPAGKDNPSALEESLPIAALLLTMLLFLGLIFSYHWGYVNSHLTARFLLFPYFIMGASALYAFKREPFWLLVIASFLTLFAGILSSQLDGPGPGFSYYLVLLAFAGLAGLHLKDRSVQRIPQVMALFWVLFLLCETFPAINQRQYERDYLPIPRTKAFLEWVDSYSGTNSVFISNSPYYGILNKESATSIERFSGNPQRLLSLAGNKRFSNIFVMQEVGRVESGELIPYAGYQLPPEITFETVEEKRIVGDFGVRLVRITGIRKDPAGAVSE
ncbi:MAG: glycosyltransferase family 39 protein [Puniceicoccaceae bacterium]